MCLGIKFYINKGECMNKLLERIRIKDIVCLVNVFVGIVDWVFYGCSGVLEVSCKCVEEILK